MNTIVAVVFACMFLARHVPQLVIDLSNRHRPVTHTIRSPVRAIHVTAVYILIVACSGFAIWQRQPSRGSVIMALLVWVAGASFGMAGLAALRRNYAEELQVLSGATLVTTGIYGIVRHPFRLGLAMEAAGFVIVSERPFLALLLALMVVLQVIRSRAENRLLVQAFGEAADKYVRMVPAVNVFVGAMRWRNRRQSEGQRA